jgi:hypothetical protein
MSGKLYTEGIPTCSECKQVTEHEHIMVHLNNIGGLRVNDEYFLCDVCYKKLNKKKEDCTMIEETNNISPVDAYKNLKHLARWYRIKELTDVQVLQQLLTIETKARWVSRIKATIKKLGKK